MYCSVSIARPEHYMQAILCEVLFQFESQTVSSVYPQQKQHGQQGYSWNPKHPRKSVEYLCWKRISETKLPVSKPWTEQRNYHRKLKTIKNVHTPAKLNNHVSLLFRREFKRNWNRLGGDKSPLGTFTEHYETKRWSIRQSGVDTNSKPDQNGPISMWK